MNIRKALGDIASIRQRLHLIDTRRAFRCFSIAISAVVFVVAACVQPAAAAGLETPQRFVFYWLVIASGCAAMIAAEVAWRSASTRSRINASWSLQLAGTMAPAAVAMALVTWALLGQAGTAAFLPGIWALLGGVGVASCGRLLPAICQVAAVWLVVGGAVAIRVADVVGENTAVTMIFLFGIGQILLAVCLYAGVKSDG